MHRVERHITTSRDLSIRLAALARTIRDHIHTALAIESEHGPLKKLMKAFREVLVHDLDADGFADMYAQTIGFKGVSENVWNFHIGGYQVCQKWLKDRKGRNLSKDDITHYQKIVVALNETIRLMKEIDEVIEQHGGWPRAFVKVFNKNEYF